MNELRTLEREEMLRFEAMETESAPSGEWAEYNVGWLQSEGFVDGISAAVDAVGTCGQCKHYEFREKVPHHNICTLQSDYRSSDHYCADFDRVTEEREG